MLKAIGVASIEELFQAVPSEVRLKHPLDVPPALTEIELQQHMEELARQGLFAPPSLETSERAFEYGLGLRAGRVLLDLWNLEHDPTCSRESLTRLRRMNLSQRVESRS